MKRIVLVTLMLIAISLIGLSAQTRGKQTHDDFSSFWLRFKAAVAASDKEAVASMTKLPFLWEGQERDKTGFIKKFDAIFDKRARRCFGTGRPVKDGTAYDLDCGDEIFMFDKIDGQYKFIDVGAND